MEIGVKVIGQVMAPGMVTAAKMPPPEPQSAVRRRLIVILSFWVVILFFGLPMWWKTTSVYRSQLPFDKMLQVPYQPEIPIEIRLTSQTLPTSEIKDIGHKVQQALDDLNDYPVIHHRISYEPTEKDNNQVDDPDLTIELSQGTDLRSRFEERTPGRQYLAVQHPANAAADLVDYLAKRIQHVYLDEHISAAQQYASHSTSNARALKFLQSSQQEDVDRVRQRTARAFKHSGDYNLVFSLFSADDQPSDWAIRPALQNHILPIIQALSKTSNFSLTSQIQLYSAFSPSVHPIANTGGQGYLLRRDELSAFINTAEWPLSPSIGAGPTINFVLYVPSKDQSPLYIEGSPSNTWLIPQWGVISVLNPGMVLGKSDSKTHHPGSLDAGTLRQPFEQYAHQLLALLGVPTGDIPLSLRVRAYQRIAGLSLFLRAASSLGSLGRLAGHLSSIPIPKHVSLLVVAALDRLSVASNYFGAGRTIPGIQQAYTALRDADKAFFDKSMVGQVYFPDEHKVAVYLPLLGPVGVPLAVALIRELRKLFSKSKG